VKTPIVYLVGAGPGDPALITVRGVRCLAACDVVVYDHLVDPRLLRLAPPEAERIDVGAASPQPLQQEAISYLLAEKAREGKTVVRLKWGDPFVFDDGGKEALFLNEQGVPFQIVPGVPAAIGVPTYAGVPITYPGAGDTVTFVRGHESESDDPPKVDWTGLARLDGTIVCYASPKQLVRVLDGLLGHGRPKHDTAALIYNGTLPTQQTMSGTLDEIARMAKRPTSRLPAILVVGKVAALRDHLRWFDARPLFGKRIVVTRSREQAPDLVDMLEELGAGVIEAPTIRILPPADFTKLDEMCARAAEFNWIVFTSANGVEWFMRRLIETGGDVRSLKGVKLCTVGPATADRLKRYGIRIDLMPDEARAEAMVEALKGTGDLHGTRVLLPRADIAREVLADELRKAGADVVEVAAYRTVVEESDRDIYRMLLEKQVDAVTFTSASTVRNFVKTLGAEPAADLLQSIDVASIGPVTAEAAQQLGIRTTIMPATYTVPALVQAIVAHYGSPPSAAA
jgi:uroporphyrinogen III methyltransferase/synthase